MINLGRILGVDDLIADGRLLTDDEARSLLQKVREAFPEGTDWTCRIALAQHIAEFEAWQQTPDEDYSFEAIHVAHLIAQGYGKTLHTPE